MANVVEFFKESYNEMVQKVSWPTWSELTNSAVLVLIASVIIAILVYAMDAAAGGGLRFLYESMV